MAGPFVNRAHDKHARHTVVRGNVRSHVRSGDEWCTTIHSNLFDLRSHVAERDGVKRSGAACGRKRKGIGVERRDGASSWWHEDDGGSGWPSGGQIEGRMKRTPEITRHG